MLRKGVDVKRNMLTKIAINFLVDFPVYYKHFRNQSKMLQNCLPYYRVIEVTSPLSFIIRNQLMGQIHIIYRPVLPTEGTTPQQIEIKATEMHNLQKTVSGGVLLIEISFRNEYFCVKLFTCDHNKLGITVNQQVCHIDFIVAYFTL